MKRLITPSRIREMEQAFMKESGMPGLLLMEHAAQAVARILLEMTEAGALFLCGGGNNGGDGWAAARIFASMGRKAVIWSLKDPESLQGDAKINADLAMKLGIETHVFTEKLPQSAPQGCGAVADALFGTGLSRNLEGVWRQAVEWMNGCGLPVLAVDIPSGVDGESGRILGCAVRAARTVTFHRMKNGHLLYPGREYAGELTVEEIGLPQEDGADGLEVFGEEDVLRLLPPRDKQAHKGSGGHALIVGGSMGMTGACAFSAEAALRGGAGLVTMACPKDAQPVLQAVFPCAMCRTLEELPELVEGKTCVALGPGLGEYADAALEEALLHEGKKVIDADGLNALSRKKKAPQLRDAVLTPHPGEAARLLGWTTAQVTENPRQAALEIHRKYGAVVLLKGASTVITDGNRMAVNRSGSPALAVGGSGDILTGLIAAMICQKIPAFEAACLGAYLHGKAGENAGKTRGIRSVTPRDILEEIRIE